MDDDDIEEYPTQRIRLQQCQICGRQFNTDTLKKHQVICRKITNSKRKVFDAGKQRAKDSDVPYKATKRTALIYNGEVRAQDDKAILKSKANWREKHQQLIRSIREARTVTQAIKEGGPLPAFRPSDIPSDYVSCPYCHRNFNEHACKRHMPFCQTQHQRKQIQPSRPNKQFDRGRTLPPQQSSQYKQQSSSSGMHSNSQDVYNNGYKHSNSAPMIVRRNPSEFQPLPPPPPPPRTTAGGSGWGGFRKLFGLGSKEESVPATNYYPPEDEDEYEQPVRQSIQQKPVLMRTGRTQENTSLNVNARQRNDDTGSYVRRGPPPPVAPSSYGQTRPQYDNGQYNSTRPQYGNGQNNSTRPQYGNGQNNSTRPQYGNGQHNSTRPHYDNGQQNSARPQYGNGQQNSTRPQYGNGQQNSTRPQYGNGQQNSTRPTAVGRPPPQSSGIRCGECGGLFNNASARYCPQCGSRR